MGFFGRVYNELREGAKQERKLKQYEPQEPAQPKKSLAARVNSSAPARFFAGAANRGQRAVSSVGNYRAPEYKKKVKYTAPRF